MELARFPRRRYTQGMTPIEHLPRLSKKLNGPNLYMKRDDLLGLTEGGNKTRKLEFLVADALQKGADTLVTCGAIQSNHCRLTLAAAVKEGLHCRMVLEERVPDSYHAQASGNNLLYQLLGAEEIKVVPKGADMEEEMHKLAKPLLAEGRKPYIIPGGGSNETGALGYVNCAHEINWQSAEKQLPIDAVVLASGSGGTHAGMLTGFERLQRQLPIYGINVSRPQQEQQALVHHLAQKTATYIEPELDIPREKVVCVDDYVGPGYSLSTPGMVEAVKLLARLEGILLDPVYTGKAMAGLIDLVRQGVFAKDDNVLFVHTGGTPALYHYTSEFVSQESIHTAN